MLNILIVALLGVAFSQMANQTNITNTTLCPGRMSFGPYTMNNSTNTSIPLPYNDTQFAIHPLYKCSSNSDCFYNKVGPTDVFVQSPVIEGDIRNNFMIDFSKTTCQPDRLRFGIAWSSFCLPTNASEVPFLIVRGAKNVTLLRKKIEIQKLGMFISTEVIYSGLPAVSFEIQQIGFNTPATRFAVDDLEFCCGNSTNNSTNNSTVNTTNLTKLCYNPCFPTGNLTSDGKCKCAPGRSGPNAQLVNKTVIVADNCNTACVTDCLNIPDGQGAPAQGPCGPCIPPSSGKWQNPLNGVCFASQAAGLTNGENVKGQPSCFNCTRTSNTTH